MILKLVHMFVLGMTIGSIETLSAQTENEIIDDFQYEFDIDGLFRDFSTIGFEAEFEYSEVLWRDDQPEMPKYSRRNRESINSFADSGYACQSWYYASFKPDPTREAYKFFGANPPLGNG